MRFAKIARKDFAFFLGQLRAQFGAGVMTVISTAVMTASFGSLVSMLLVIIVGAGMLPVMIINVGWVGLLYLADILTLGRIREMYNSGIPKSLAVGQSTVGQHLTVLISVAWTTWSILRLVEWANFGPGITAVIVSTAVFHSAMQAMALVFYSRPVALAIARATQSPHFSEMEKGEATAGALVMGPILPPPTRYELWDLQMGGRIVPSVEKEEQEDGDEIITVFLY